MARGDAEDALDAITRPGMIYNIRRVTISRHHDDQVQRYGG